jgi:hypothetical protein
MHFPLALALCLLPVLSFIGGCQQQPAATLPTANVQVGKNVYKLELATTDATRRHGLMERDNLDHGSGMLFVFLRPEVLGFYMYHTRFDLDIINLDAGGVVVSIKTMKAYDTQTISSDYAALYAIELLKGEAANSGVKVGEKIKIPADAVTSE